MAKRKTVDTLVALLCDPEGNVSIVGSEEDLRLLQIAIDDLKTQIED